MNETAQTDKTEEIEEEKIENDNDNDYTNLIIDNTHVSRVSEKLNDVIITQSIICLLTAIGIIVFNLVRPQAAKLLFDRFVELSQTDLSGRIRETFEQMKSLL
ncbi:MAG: hypothetical protein Q4F95_06090 [Oscillospiraceae bacterium]|nr:hypothetical protein [Oscillospiraceae bacterium]